MVFTLTNTYFHHLITREDNLQEGIGNVQRVLGVVQDFSKKDNTNEVPKYKPRPLYKHFED